MKRNVHNKLEACTLIKEAINPAEMDLIDWYTHEGVYIFTSMHDESGLLKCNPDHYDVVNDCVLVQFESKRTK